MGTGHYVYVSIDDYAKAGFEIRSEKVKYPSITIPTLHSLAP
jgi:hypothetical protein